MIVVSCYAILINGVNTQHTFTDLSAGAAVAVVLRDEVDGG
ncbi:hypothetical protein P6P90_01120 [Ectobacillus antri]|uniref:Uncharacterized protein n=1 Tax=Ectobacillus antri TaxID=2486280 RepID=A0ABT6H2E2_9BACI|nr:hypothetical protein [Ectobacillus antri]MDG4655926.1 hypothetical protein [Ectobacillus antri]MDG5752601.1 hypothetical protein [Ectobacillus antri]